MKLCKTEEHDKTHDAIQVDYEDCVEDGELGDDITSLGNQFGIPLTFNAYIQVYCLLFTVLYIQMNSNFSIISKQLLNIYIETNFPYS